MKTNNYANLRNNQQHIIIRARCARQFIVYLAIHEHSKVFKSIYTNCLENVCPEK